VSAQPKAVADTIKSEKDLKASLEAVASTATGKTKTDLEKILSEQFITPTKPPHDKGWRITVVRKPRNAVYWKPPEWTEEQVNGWAAQLGKQFPGAEIIVERI
jgi:hypothetical protein